MLRVSIMQENGIFSVLITKFYISCSKYNAEICIFCSTTYQTAEMARAFKELDQRQNGQKTAADWTQKMSQQVINMASGTPSSVPLSKPSSGNLSKYFSGNYYCLSFFLFFR